MKCEIGQCFFEEVGRGGPYLIVLKLQLYKCRFKAMRLTEATKEIQEKEATEMQKKKATKNKRKKMQNYRKRT